MRIKMNLKRALSFVLVLCMVLGMVNIIPVAHAADSGEQMLYLKPNSNWTQASARFAAYFFGNGEKWVDMVDSDGNGVYEVPVQAGFPSVIFCRMNPSASANNWNNKWNQSGDLTVSGNVGKCFTVPNGVWDGSTTGWGTYSNSYTVTFDMNGHGDTIEDMTVPEGGKGVKPTNPDAVGFAFGGWYTDAACTSAEYTFENVITKNITLYAKWVEVTKEYTVTFDLGEHGENDTKTVAEGLKVTKPADPTDDGWLFDGWYTDEECTVAYDFNTPVMADITLHAKWLLIEDVTVSLHFQDVSAWGAVRIHIWNVDAATEWPGTALNDNDGDGWYTATITAKIGQTVNFLFNNGGSGTDEKKTADLTTGMVLAPVELWVQGNEIFTEKPALVVPDYYVAGFNGNWASDAHLMTYNEATQLYEIVFTDVAAGEQKFKVTDGTWNNAWGGGPNPDGDGNYVITVPKRGDVTIKFNAATKAITLSIVSYPVVTFEMNGHGTAIEAQTVAPGGTATEPTAPTAEGYTFGGWYTDVACETAYDFERAVDTDITLYAKWTEKVYYVAGNIAEKFPDADHRMTYNADGGYYEKTYFLAPTGRYEIEIVDGDNNTCSNVDIINLSMISDITVKFYERQRTVTSVKTPCCSVNFEMNGHGEAVETQIISSGGKATEPAAPTAVGYTFGGWYTNAECSGEPYNFNAEVTGGITLYAKWIEEEVVTYTVTFDMNGHGDTIADQIITEGEKAVAPAAPAAEGYTFGGWYTNAECENAYNFDTVLTGDITLYAKWTVNQYTITFVTGDGVDPVDPITADYGTAVTAPEDPTKTGYTFTGWDVDIPTTMPAENLTITAQWTINQYTITFVTGEGGTVIEPITQDYGTAVTVPEDPTREGYTFTGWDKEIPETMPAENLTVTAQWTENEPEPEPEELVIYFAPNANWRQANARFTAYFFGGGEQWIPMTDADGDKVWEVTVPAGFEDVIFVRMDPNKPANNWDSKWNQTNDLKIPTDGKNCYTLAESDTWDKGPGSWSSYTPPEEPIPVTYVIAGAVTIGTEQPGVFGTKWDPANMDNLMVLNEETGLYEKTYTGAAAGSYAFKITDGSWDSAWGNGDANYVFKLEVESDFTITFNAETFAIQVLIEGEEQEPAPLEYYLVGYINGADYGIKDDIANLGTYKFVDGKITAKFTADSYVVVKDSNGTVYSADGYCTDISVTLKTSGFKIEENKMFAPRNVDLEYTLVVNADGTLTLSYTVKVDEPEIPEGANTVTIHFLRPSGWKAVINAYMWAEEDGEKVEALGGWPGKPISGNAKAGWYDLTVATDKAFNFIFNDGSSQTADLTTGEITGPTELWVVGEEIYTAAPREWTHYAVTVHYQNSNNWSSVNAYAWLGNSSKILGEWPGSAASVSANPGWYNVVLHVEIGQELFLIFNNGSGNQTADLELGVMTGNAEIWLNASGVQVARPDGWVDETRTIHLPGTIGGNAWNPAGNQMTYDAERGLYTITFEDVAPGTYEYKIAANGNWNENYGPNGVPGGSNNMKVTVAETQDVTFWYSDSSHRVVCSVNYDIDAVVALTGTNIPEGTRLTDDELDGLYTVAIQLAKGTYSDLKITCGETEVAFSEFTLSAAKNVTFSFDPSTGMGYHNGSNVKVDTTHIFYDTKDLDYKDPFGAVAVGESVKFSITTGTDATGAALVIRGIGSVGLEKDGEAVNGVQRWTCTYAFESIGEYDYYFAITNGSDMVFYCDDNYNAYFRTGDYGTGGIGNPEDIFAYDIIVHTADFKTPDWMKDAVIYQIFPDRFFDAVESNNDDQTTARGSVDYEYVNDWYMLPENPSLTDDPNYPVYALKGDGEWSNEIYGGDLKGVTERIEYLKALGVNVIYFNPVFSSISNHRYDACDYMEIDPILGTLGDFEELVAVAEANGMHIILDGVFNHVSDDSVYFDRYYKFLPLAAEKYDGKIGAYPYWAYVYDLMNEEGYSKSAAESAAKTYFSENYGITDYSYTEWFHVNNEKNTYSDKIGLRAGKKVYTYEGWWGYDSMPVIKSTNGSEFQTGNWAEEMLSHENPNSVNSYWITKGMDGWRLDVANEVSDETWRNFRDSVKALDSEAVIIGEIWHDATYYLRGDMYDSVMNYIFRDAVAGFARGYLINRDNKSERWDNDYTAEDALTTLEILRERYPEEAFYAMMNLVASHDTARILSYLDDVEDDRYQTDVEHNFPMYETTSDRAKQLQYVVAFIQFTYAGAPTIYYGDEIGMTGADDPDDRRAFTWGQGQQDLVEWYAQLAAIRAQYPALRTGSVETFAPNRDVMGYIRSDEANTLIVMANRASSAKTVALEGTYVDLISGETFTDSIVVPAYRGVILVEEDEVKSYTVNTEALAPAYDPAYIVAERGTTPPADPDPDPNPNPGTVVFTVEFVNVYADRVYKQYVAMGSCAQELVAPAVDGMVFQGWFLDEGCTVKYDFSSAVTGSITLYAGWKKAPYTVTFSMSGHGWEVSAKVVTAGEAISAPRVPVVEGYSFGGWFYDEDCTVEYVFGTPVTADITLYAKWVEKIVHAEVYEDLDQRDFYYSSIDFVIESGLMVGTGEAVFAPAENMTRAMMWTVLARMDGAELAGEDVWYDNNRKWAIKAGLTDGNAPNGGITRQEMIVMLWRYMGKPVAADGLDGYTDAESVSSWAYDAMAWAVEIGLIGIDAETELTPNGTATRAQVAALMERLCAKIDRKEI